MAKALTKNESDTREFSQRYQVALYRYVKQNTKSRPAVALELGQEAVELGVEVLDLAMIHEETLLSQTLSTKSNAARDRVLHRASTFFYESIIPMEKTHRTALENNALLTRLNQVLDQRSGDLLDSKQKLKSEISKRKTVEKALQKSERNSSRMVGLSRNMSRRILSAQEDERKRISRELHDIVAQTLTGINLHLVNLRAEAEKNSKGFTKNISYTQKLVEESVDKVHRFACELRPAVLDDLGLIPALHSFMKTFIKETGVRVSLTSFEEVEELSIVKRTVLYRVAQEALTNVARHANASRASVHIKQFPNMVRMKIKDEGRGFDVDRLLHSGKNKWMGILGMRERVEMVGGEFSVKSTPGKSTTIIAQIPFRSDRKVRATP